MDRLEQYRQIIQEILSRYVLKRRCNSHNYRLGNIFAFLLPKDDRLITAFLKFIRNLDNF